MGPNAADRPPPHFFLSYAHDGGDDDETVRRFYKDLAHDVLLHAGLREISAGFCDVSFQAGEKWSDALIENLSTAQVFVPILSPVYFASEACGREWTIFTARMAATPADRRGASLIPLLWIPMENLHPAAQEYQYKDRSLGAAYGRVGLRSLLRESRYQDDRHAFLLALAARIVHLNKRFTVVAARDRPGFDDVRSAFGPAPAGRRIPRPAAPTGTEAESHRARKHRPRQHDHMPRLNAAPFTPEDDSR